MRIAMIGAGYVGLVSGACFADFGHAVTCIDVDADRIAALRAGRMPIYEPGLEQLVADNAAAGRLLFDRPRRRCGGADVVFIAVGRPRGAATGTPTSAMSAPPPPPPWRGRSTASRWSSPIHRRSAPVTRSSASSARPIRRRRGVVSNPEFLREGAAIDDFKHPDRVVIGIEKNAPVRRWRSSTARSITTALLCSSPRRSAELIKYAANAFLAMKGVTFINGSPTSPRRPGPISRTFPAASGLMRGSAAGSSMPGRASGLLLPKDTLALTRIGEELGSPVRLIEATMAVNDERKRRMGRRVIAACGGDVRQDHRHPRIDLLSPIRTTCAMRPRWIS